jgi:hypothetical protein
MQLIGHESCPVCGGGVQAQCRCPGPHDVEELRGGAGLQCLKCHRWCWNTGLTIDAVSGKVIREAHAVLGGRGIADGG